MNSSSALFEIRLIIIDRGEGIEMREVREVREVREEREGRGGEGRRETEDT